MTSAFLEAMDERGVATLTLNRQDRHNAFDDALIAELTAALRRLGDDACVRAVILASTGRSFSAGANLEWMRRMADQSFETNLADAAGLAGLMHTLDRLPKPTLALVQGAAYGGGVGLVACCDIAIASERASFCLSEVKLGLTPATISPYVINAIGARWARRYFQTAEVFTAARAREIGLVHEVVPETQLAAAAEYCSKQSCKAPPARRPTPRTSSFCARADRSTPRSARRRADASRNAAPRPQARRELPPFSISA